ncbi:MAG: hypothetical protein J2P24_15610 [Streptosporangiales bacterium]|nr:hypothetical protein [Streptosporangiales bacterium]MBO0891512.1 hypothetical protein [Acidothermales bacterium]
MGTSSVGHEQDDDTQSFRPMSPRVMRWPVPQWAPPLLAMVCTVAPLVLAWLGFAAYLPFLSTGTPAGDAHRREVYLNAAIAVGVVLPLVGVVLSALARQWAIGGYLVVVLVVVVTGAVWLG